MHVWSVALAQPDRLVNELRCALSPDELERASRFHFERHCRSYIVARGALRRILGQYLSAHPQALRFCQGQFGKPSLAAEWSAADIRFNVSHSEDVALVAVARSVEVGVDVERCRPLRDAESLVRSCFSPAEYACFQQLSEPEKQRALYLGWTRKEAFLKATGLGLSFPLDGFDVSISPSTPARLIRVRSDLGEAAQWSLRDLDVGRDYAAALAVKSRRFRLERRCWHAAGDWRRTNQHDNDSPIDKASCRMTRFRPI